MQSDLVDLEKVLSKFESVKKKWIPSKVWSQCQLALAEGFTNAVRHAHCGQSNDTPIKIQIDLNSEEIIIRIWDYGQYFQLKTSSVSENKKLNELATGGRGIHIMQQIADELSYDRLPDNRNCLVITKRLYN